MSPYDPQGRLLVNAGAGTTLPGGGTSGGGKASAVSIDQVTTSATGANFVTLTAGACTEVVLNNAEPTAVDLRYQRGGSGASMPIPAGSVALVDGITNSSNIGIRREDQSNTQVTISFERKTRS